MVTEKMVGGWTRLEWLAFLGIESADAPILADLAELTWPGNALEVIRVNATEDGFELVPLPEPPLRGVMVRKSADQTGADYTTRTAMAFDQEVYDTDGAHDNVTENEKIKAPAGATHGRFTGSVQATSLTVDLWIRISLEKNGSLDFDGVVQANTEVGNTTVTLNVNSAWLPVVGGTDYFKLTLVNETGDTSINITAARTTFAAEWKFA